MAILPPSYAPTRPAPYPTRGERFWGRPRRQLSDSPAVGACLLVMTRHAGYSSSPRATGRGLCQVGLNPLLAMAAPPAMAIRPEYPPCQKANVGMTVPSEFLSVLDGENHGFPPVGKLVLVHFPNAMLHRQLRLRACFPCPTYSDDGKHLSCNSDGGLNAPPSARVARVRSIS